MELVYIYFHSRVHDKIVAHSMQVLDLRPLLEIIVKTFKNIFGSMLYRYEGLSGGSFIGISIDGRFSGGFGGGGSAGFG